MLSLEGRTAIICGLANKRSIAWAIAQRLSAAGAQLAVTYQSERLKEDAEELIADLPGARSFQCDVAQDSEIERLTASLKEHYPRVDTLVHSIAFAPADDLKGDFLNITREGFRISQDISVYSLIALSRAAAPLMTNGGSIMTLSYYGAEKVLPNYHIMGVAKAALESSVRYLAQNLGPRAIRVNAISAGPIKTLAARGVSGFSDMLKAQSERAPLKRNVEPREVGDTALFLASDLSSGITGEVIYVDCGYNIMGL
ncbi:MAG TPA: enoyl-ACP reductase [Candidatus Angelobacter sp.]|nr:enoyl-ACP reductase [Candidatus Angelobacter sp.]